MCTVAATEHMGASTHKRTHTHSLLCFMLLNQSHGTSPWPLPAEAPHSLGLACSQQPPLPSLPQGWQVPLTGPNDQCCGGSAGEMTEPTFQRQPLTLRTHVGTFKQEVHIKTGGGAGAACG